MTDSKIESAKKLLSNGVPPRDVAKMLYFLFFQTPQSRKSVRRIFMKRMPNVTYSVAGAC